jgi:hypothetical protein
MSLMEFMQDFPDDASCLEHLWRSRFAPDGEHADCPKCKQERVFKKYATKAGSPVVDVHRMRVARSPDGRDDLRQVVNLAAPLVLRLLPGH